ncbi:MAG: biopolymer transporter ExbD [Pseudomonadota bacterium]|nr:MAG: biopolymer transporter ExbD [Pseudomonadota bacterium]
MKHLRSRRGRRKAEADLNITAFMNLMVILVPFLLITAVFSRLTILELNLPTDAKTNEPPKQEFQLQIVIRDAAIDVADNKGGLIKRIPRISGKHDYKQLSTLLQQVKARFPDKTTATILPEQNTHYETLVHVMDAVRMFRVVQGTEVVNAELFPDISIGDAP